MSKKIRNLKYKSAESTRRALLKCDYDALKTDFENFKCLVENKWDCIKNDLQSFESTLENITSMRGIDEEETKKLFRKYNQLKIRLGVVEKDVVKNSTLVLKIADQTLRNTVAMKNASASCRGDNIVPVPSVFCGNCLLSGQQSLLPLSTFLPQTNSAAHCTPSAHLTTGLAPSVEKADNPNGLTRITKPPRLPLVTPVKQIPPAKPVLLSRKPPTQTFPPPRPAPSVFPAPRALVRHVDVRKTGPKKSLNVWR